MGGTGRARAGCIRVVVDRALLAGGAHRGPVLGQGVKFRSRIAKRAGTSALRRLKPPRGAVFARARARLAQLRVVLPRIAA